jgi:hypothetical protein
MLGLGAWAALAHTGIIERRGHDVAILRNGSGRSAAELIVILRASVLLW